MWKHRIENNDASLTKLCIPKKEKLCDEGVALFAVTMAKYKNSSIKIVDLTMNGISDIGATALCEILPKFEIIPLNIIF